MQPPDRSKLSPLRVLPLTHSRLLAPDQDPYIRTIYDVKVCTEDSRKMEQVHMKSFHS